MSKIICFVWDEPTKAPTPLPGNFEIFGYYPQAL